MNEEPSQDSVQKRRFKLGLRHWTGTVIVAIVAGFVIFGMLRGQEWLGKFLEERKIERIKAEFDKNIK